MFWDGGLYHLIKHLYSALESSCSFYDHCPNHTEYYGSYLVTGSWGISVSKSEGGGVWGILSFFLLHRLGPSIYCLLLKYRVHTLKILEILKTISILYLDLKTTHKKQFDYSNGPKTVQISGDPQKYQSEVTHFLSVVEGSTWDRKVTSLRLTRGTVLCP